ncbi:MAG: MBL fold metallo-hydrolase [Alphaproteobacteria bacterium]|nr:MBL fold metallo-hydrolase [Alphaproteobacteria bacterium]
MLFRQLFDPETSTYTYLLADETTREAVLIDPVREQFDRDRQLLDELALTLVYTLDTHVHADHVTAAGMFREAVGSKSVVSAHGGAACADVQVDHGERIYFGSHALQVRRTPGHTDGCVSYVDDTGRRVFTGDAMLIRGCGRTDFQQGDAATLYRSIHEQVFSLPDDYAIYPGHDYKGRTSSTVGEEKEFNPRLGGGRTVAQFVAIMDGLKLAEPKKIAEAVPANLACGRPQLVEGPWAPIEETPTGIPEVDVAWVRDTLGSHRIIDVRSVMEFEGPDGHIPGAELVPLASLGVVAASWDKDTPLITVCRSGGRSARAALGLMSMGFDKVVSMRGGMMAWNADELAGAATSCG